MEYMTLKEASEKWGVSVRRINLLCSSGRICGAIKKQNLWLIPSSAEKPSDGRRKKVPLKEPGVLLGNATYVEYHSTSDICDYDRDICEGNLLFLEGHLDESYTKFKNFTRKCTDKQYLLIAYHILNCNSIYVGDKKAYIFTTKEINKLIHDPDVSSLTKALVQLNNMNSSKPNAALLEADSKIMQDLAPYLSCLVLRSLLKSALVSSLGNNLIFPDVVCSALKGMNCPDVYVHCNIMMAVYFCITGATSYAQMYIKEAAAVAFPRKWYTPFAQYAIFLDMNYLESLDQDSYSHIKILADKIFNNYLISNVFSDKFSRPAKEDILITQVAYQISCKKTNSEIASHLEISMYKVKKTIADIYERTGFTTRTELRDYFLSHIII